MQSLCWYGMKWSVRTLYIRVRVLRPLDFRSVGQTPGREWTDRNIQKQRWPDRGFPRPGLKVGDNLLSR